MLSKLCGIFNNIFAKFNLQKSIIVLWSRKWQPTLVFLPGESH